MSTYVFGTSLSYQDYLQARSFERSLRAEIRSSTKSIIASNEELQQQNYSVLTSLSSSVSSGFEQISLDLERISTGIGELNATFYWGFSELLAVAGRINDSLDDLVRLVGNPAQTWAYNQFEIARDAFRKRLYEEAIEYLDRAINGYGSETGYKIEYRFHFLLGTIMIESPEIVNPASAERAFLSSARYAWQDEPREAALALLGAGWAAYCQGKMSEAERYTEQAIALNDSLAEAYFQLAKVQMHTRKPDQALPRLRQAILLDRAYMIKAATDDDFKLYETQVALLYDTLRNEARNDAESTFSELDRAIEMLERHRVEAFQFADVLNSHRFNQFVSQAVNAANHHTYYGYLNSIQLCNQAREELADVSTKMQLQHQQRSAQFAAEQRQRNAQFAAEQRRREADEYAARVAQSVRARSNATTAIWLAGAGSVLCPVLVPIGFILGIVSLVQFGSGRDTEGQGKAIAAVIIGSLWTVFFVVWILAAIARA
ncbi:MAG: hypothetical protein AABO41_14060 [Acidobacteriota bacterium]